MRAEPRRLMVTAAHCRLLTALVALAAVITALVTSGFSAPAEPPNAATSLGQALVVPASAGAGARLTERVVDGARSKLATYLIGWHAPAARVVTLDVQAQGGPRLLFSGGGSDGTARANFVQRGLMYVFTLYVPGLTRPIAVATVRRP